MAVETQLEKITALSPTVMSQPWALERLRAALLESTTTATTLAGVVTALGVAVSALDDRITALEDA